MTDRVQLINGDCFETLAVIETGSVNLVLVDPPYNVKVKTMHNGRSLKNDWDDVENYEEFCRNWLRESHRVLKDNGVLYFWQNDMNQIPSLIKIAEEEGVAFVSFCIWNKGDACRARTWHDRDPDGKTALRSWFNVCEYCLHFFKVSKTAQSWCRSTGLERVYSDPNCFKSLKEWYRDECKRLGLGSRQIGEKYTAFTGKKPFMLRHYFQNNQFEIPTERVYKGVYIPLGFNKSYETLRNEYETLRHYHRCDEMHCNVWNVPPIPSTNRLHTCQKPVEILRRIIRVSCPPDGLVLDFFMGSGSTGVAAVKEDRRFIGVEKAPAYFDSAKKRIEIAISEPEQITMDIPKNTRRQRA